MTFRKFTAMASMAASLVCLCPQQLLAGIYGRLEYTNNGSWVSITKYNNPAPGSPPVPETLEIPATIEGKPVTEIEEYAFSGAQLTNISIPSGVSLNPYSFYRSPTLQNVTVADGLSTIGEYAFYRCEKLKSIKMATGTISIGQYAFLGCDSLESVFIPAGISYMAPSPFWSCHKLKNVTLSEGITEIFDSMFVGCEDLESLIIPSTVTRIGSYAFSGCSLKSLVIPEGVKVIGDFPFGGSKMKTLRIPAGVTQVGQGLFAGCVNLVKVELAGNITEIGDKMFSDCGKLTQFTIPGTVTRIGAQAFAFSGLNMIIIPKGVREIEKGAFEECYHLEGVLFKGNAPILGKRAFPKNPKFKIFVSEGVTGYTFPEWKGYPISMPQPEIAVLVDDGTLVKDGKFIFKFPNLVVDEKSAVKRVTIVNVGALKLTGLNAKVKGSNSSDFTIKYLGKNSLAPGKTAVLEFRFAPKKGGQRKADLNIYSNDKDENPLVLGLQGTGLTLVP